MEVMFELTRRCDMQCSHCLRGDAEGLDMDWNMVRKTMDTFGSYSDKFSFGGGEAILKPKLVAQFRQQLAWSGINTQWMESMWIVSNGKRLMKQDAEALKYGIESAEEAEPIVKELIKLSRYIPITLAISTDPFHDKGAEERYRYIEDMFEHHDEITVCQHGPRESFSDLVGMGRQQYGGIEVKVSATEEDCNLIYVSVKGDIYPSCDLSYNFMDQFTETALCFGSIMVDSYDDIMENRRRFLDIMEHQGESILPVMEDDIGDLELYTEEFDALEPEKQLILQDGETR